MANALLGAVTAAALASVASLQASKADASALTAYARSRPWTLPLR